MENPNKLRPVGQQRAVLQYLCSGKTLTHLEALLYLGVGRLSSVMCRLKAMKVEFTTEKPEKGKRYVAYRLTNPDAVKALLAEAEEA